MFKSFLLLIAVSIVLAGCTGMPKHAKNIHSTPDVIAESPVSGPLTLPDVELSEELLYKILTADMAVQRGQHNVAITHYLGLANTTQDSRLARKAARIAIFARQNKQALEAAELWIQLDPNSLEARQAITAAYIRNGDPDAAMEQLDILLSLTTTDPTQGFMMIASLLSREDDLQTALVVMGRFIGQRQENPEAHYAYGHLALRAGELHTAQQAIDNALKLKPNWLSAVLLRARIYQLQNQHQQGVDYLAQAVKKNPKDLSLRMTYARILVDTQKYEEAIPQYEKAIKQSPGNAEILFTVGLLSLQLNRLEKAKDYLTRVKALGLRASDVNFYLGRIEEVNGDYGAAQQYYEAVNNGENYLEAKTRIAVLIAKDGDIDAARSRLHELLTKSPAQRDRIYLVEGDILRDVELYPEAMAVYDIAIEELPENIPLLYARAIVAEKMDRLDLAEQDLIRILDLEPDNVDALNALGYTLADRTNRYQEAYDYIKRALELKPEDNAILDSMGWVLYRLGDHQEAINYLRRSLELRPDPEVAAHLGEVLWITGVQDGAREIWEHALKNSPGDKLIIEVMERLVK